MRKKTTALNDQDWQEIWLKFDALYDSKSFAPRNTTQKKWIQKLTNTKMKQLGIQPRRIVNRDLEILDGVFESEHGVEVRSVPRE